MADNHGLKRTRQLHEHFVDAVSRLGGANRANPRSVKRTMGVPSLTLHHLQKYRLAMGRKPEASTGNCRSEDCVAADCSADETQSAHVRMRGDQTQINNGMLQTQLEVQRNLDEQIEVQRHLQLRIEAERKYLQSVLRKAQEMLASYNIDSAPMEAAEDTEQADCTDNSCLTSCEIPPDGNDDKPCKQEASEDSDDISTGAEKPIENLVGRETGGSTGCSTSCEGNYAPGLPGSANRHSHQRKNY